MGKLVNGILGGFRGTIGPVVGTQWKGIEVMRSRPPRKRRKSTEAQLKQMAKLSLMTQFVHPLTAVTEQDLSPGYCPDVLFQPGIVV